MFRAWVPLNEGPQEASGFRVWGLGVDSGFGMFRVEGL